jgi:hypothetical protein
MTAIFDGGDRHDDFNEELWRCTECGGWNSPDDGDFIATPRGPLCANCSGRSEGEAA